LKDNATKYIKNLDICIITDRLSTQNPINLEIFRDIANTLLKMGNLTGSEIYFDKILKINPTDQIALDSLNKMQQGIQNNINYNMTNRL